LRKEKSRFLNVGSCFVLGWMDGEAREKINQGEFSLQIFDIE